MPRRSPPPGRRPRVALVVEASGAYDREMLGGVADYLRSHRPWSVFVEQPVPGTPPPEWLSHRQWDGILCRPTTPALTRAFARTGTPAVDLSDNSDGLGLPRVRPDDPAIGRLAAAHLLERGFRSFAYCGFAGEAWATGRREGFAAAAGGDLAVYESPRRGQGVPAWDEDADRIAAWLGRLPRPLGVFACNDPRGRHVLEACLRAGLAVPEQVAVVGVDNDELLCRLSDPPLSSVVPDARRIGYQAAELLAGLMAGGQAPEADTLVAPVAVAPRQSTDTLAIDDPEVAAAVRFIREHACDGIRVRDVLARVPVTRAIFERRFHQAIGRTPHAEIRRTQVRRAAQLLAETDLSLSQVADLTGFPYPEYLGFLIKRSTGQSPRAYRRALPKPPEH